MYCADVLLSVDNSALRRSISWILDISANANEFIVPCRNNAKTIVFNIFLFKNSTSKTCLKHPWIYFNIKSS